MPSRSPHPAASSPDKPESPDHPAVPSDHPAHPAIKSFYRDVREYYASFRPDDTLSLDQFLEEAESEDGKGLEPASPENLEETVMLRMIITDLLKQVHIINPKYGRILDLICEDYTKGQILDELHLGKAQGYADIKAAQLVVAPYTLQRLVQCIHLHTLVKGGMKQAKRYLCLPPYTVHVPA